MSTVKQKLIEFDNVLNNNTNIVQIKNYIDGIDVNMMYESCLYTTYYQKDILTPLVLAAYQNRIDVVLLLLKKGALYKSEALKAAFFINAMDCFKLIWKSGGILPPLHDPNMNLFEKYTKKLETVWNAVKRAQKATFTVLLIRKTKIYHKDVMMIIAKMVWESRRDWDDWI